MLKFAVLTRHCYLHAEKSQGKYPILQQQLVPVGISSLDYSFGVKRGQVWAGDSGAPALCSCASSVQAVAMGVNARHLCVVLLLSFLALVLG